MGSFWTSKLTSSDSPHPIRGAGSHAERIDQGPTISRRIRYQLRGSYCKASERPLGACMRFGQYFDNSAPGCGITDANGRLHATQLDCSARTIENYETYYTGAAFDLAQDPHPNEMTQLDLFLVGSLSMSRFMDHENFGKMREKFSQDLAASRACTNAACLTHFACVLKRIPAGASIYGVTTTSQIWNDVNTLWTLIGPLVLVTSNAPASRTKPLARKRPALIPILDDEGSIADQRQKGVSRNFWDHILNEVNSDHQEISLGGSRLRHQGIGLSMTDLRIVDVITWMRMKRPISRCA
jgi:Family of unknown function (DUF6308)